MSPEHVEQALFLADAPAGAGGVIRGAIAQAGLTFTQIMAWVWSNKTKFLQIALEFAQGQTAKAIDDLIGLVTASQPSPAA